MPSEQQILKEIRKIIPSSAKYLFDDCALIEKDLVITSDTIVQDVHFDLKNYKPIQIGRKSMAVNLSDIASMGAKPLYALVSLSLPKSINLEFIKDLYKGIQACAKKYKTQIIGGNLTSAKEISVTITLMGRAKNPALRKNAKPGDLVFCTGTFGNAAAEYLLLKQSKILTTSSLRTPLPQIDIGHRISSLSKKPCIMDSSDGLADCLIQISDQSNVKIIIDENKIPTSKRLKSLCKIIKKDPLMLSLYGGEDYQLVGTISSNDYKKIKKLKDIKIIGKVVKGKGAFLKQKNSKLVKLSMNKSFKHFA